jgi:hypothetical protein
MTSEITPEELTKILDRITRGWKTGRPVFRDAMRFREMASQLLDAPRVDWFSELMHDPRTHHAMAQHLGAEPDAQSSFMVWLAQRLREVSDTSSWFRVSEGLVWKLLATDLKGALIADLQLPLPAFYLELPPGVFYLEDKKTGWHEARAMSVVTGCISEKTIKLAKAAGDYTASDELIGDRIVIEAYGEPNSNSKAAFDDTWIFKSYNITDRNADIEQVLEQASEREKTYEQHLNRGRIGNREVNGWELREVMLRFVLNLCIYLGSEEARVEHAHAVEIKRLHGDKKFKNLRAHIQQKIRDLQADKVFVVGSDVTISPEMRDLVRNEGAGSHTLSYRTLVRGHWRNQAHGPGYTLRKRRWIEPHIRGNELPTKLVGHNYNVK